MATNKKCTILDYFSILQTTINLENFIIEQDPNTVAAFIAEPIMGAGGVIVPPDMYFKKIHPVLKKYDILFEIPAYFHISDQCGIRSVPSPPGW